MPVLNIRIRSYYGASVPSALAVMGGIGFTILNSIIGGQAISGLTNGHLSWTYGYIHHCIIYRFLTC